MINKKLTVAVAASLTALSGWNSFQALGYGYAVKEPPAPTIVNTDIGDREIFLYLSFDAGGSSSPVLIAICTNATQSFIGSGAVSPVVVKDMHENAEYTCEALVSNEAGVSAPSEHVNVLLSEYISTGLPIWLLGEAARSNVSQQE